MCGRVDVFCGYSVLSEIFPAKKSYIIYVSTYIHIAAYNTLISWSLFLFLYDEYSEHWSWTMTDDVKMLSLNSEHDHNVPIDLR